MVHLVDFCRQHHQQCWLNLVAVYIILLQRKRDKNRVGKRTHRRHWLRALFDCNKIKKYGITFINFYLTNKRSIFFLNIYFVSIMMHSNLLSFFLVCSLQEPTSFLANNSVITKTWDILLLFDRMNNLFSRQTLENTVRLKIHSRLVTKKKKHQK